MQIRVRANISHSQAGLAQQGLSVGSEGEHNSREGLLGLRRSLTQGEPILASAGTSANRVDVSPSHTRLTAPAGCYTSQCTHDSCLELKINVAQAGSCESPPRQGHVCSRAPGNGRALHCLGRARPCPTPGPSSSQAQTAQSHFHAPQGESWPLPGHRHMLSDGR